MTAFVTVIFVQLDDANAMVSVVENLDSAIHRISRYLEDKYYENQLRYPLDSNLSSGLIVLAIHVSNNWGLFYLLFAPSVSVLTGCGCNYYAPL